MDEELENAIESIVDGHYETYEGPATLTVRQIKRYLDERVDRVVSRNEVEVACDELVDQDRLVFLRDHGEDGRRYCSTKVPAATVELLREPME